VKKSNKFYARQHILYAIARICHANSVRPSVCLSHACIVSKRLNVSSKFFHYLIILVFRHQGSLHKSDGFTPNGGSKYKGGSNFWNNMWLYLGNVIDRGKVTMEDEYKVVCALSNGATFDDLEWPQTPVSRSQYSLKANISQTVHLIHSMFGSRLRLSGSVDRMALFAVRLNQDGGWRPSWIYKNGHNFTTVLPIDVMFASRVRFSGSADLMVALSMTLSDPEPHFQGRSIA